MAEQKEPDQLQSRRPQDTAFKQQRLKAWQPILTPKYVISAFFAIGLLFIPIGIVVLIAANSVAEQTVRYDNKCDIGKTCPIVMEIDSDFKPPIYMYYGLTEFYQNHRRYVKSRSDDQLQGEVTDTSGCDPLQSYKDVKLYPCGLIANSLFTDRFSAVVTFADGSAPLPLSKADPSGPGGYSSVDDGANWMRKGIAWSSDLEKKFVDKSGDAALKDTTQVGPAQARQNTTLPKDVTNEDFVVWMRPAALPTFRKLHRIIPESFGKTLKKGDKITFHVENKFPTDDFGGEKRIILSTTSWLGGKNTFLGYAYIVVGALCVALATFFLIKHKLSPRQLGDLSALNLGTNWD